MMEEIPSFAAGPRHGLNPFPGFHNPPAQQQASVSFTSQLDPSLQALDSGDAFAQHFQAQLDNGHGQHLHVGNPPYQAELAPPRFQELRSHTAPPRRRQNPTVKQGGQFGVLTPTPQAQQIPQHSYLQHDALERIQQENGLLQLPGSLNGEEKKDGHFANMKAIPNPPNLQAWRERLFDVDETITLTEDEYVGGIVSTLLSSTALTHDSAYQVRNVLSAR